MKYIVLLILISSSIRVWAQPQEEPLFSESTRLFQQKQYEQSAQKLQTLLKTDPDQPLYLFNFGNCAYMVKKYDRAVKAYQKVIAQKAKLAPAARLYLAKTYKAMGRHDLATKELDQLLKSAPPSGIVKSAATDQEQLDLIEAHEESALESYQLGDFKSAQSQLEQHPFEDLSTDGRLLLGMAQLKQKKYAQAEQNLEALKKTPYLSEDTKSTIAELSKRARRNESETKPYWLELGFSLGTTNNVFADGKSISPVASTLQRLQAGFGYHFNQNKVWSEKVGFSIFQETPEKAPELKSLSQTVQASGLYQKGNLDFSATPYLQTQTWNQVWVGQRTGLTLATTWTRDPFEYGFEMDLSNQESKSTDYIYLKGEARSLKPYIGWWDRDIYAQIFWAAGTDGTQDIVYADGSTLPLTQSYQGPGLKVIWKPSDKWATSLWLYSLQRNYKNGSLPTMKARKDQELGSSLKFSYWFTPNLSAYQLTEWVSNSSSLGADDVRDKNYQILVLLAGFSWDVF